MSLLKKALKSYGGMVFVYNKSLRVVPGKVFVEDTYGLHSLRIGEGIPNPKLFPWARKIEDCPRYPDCPSCTLNERFINQVQKS